MRELAGPVDAAIKSLADADWKSYATYLQSRPDEAELQAIRLMLSLCRQYGFHCTSFISRQLRRCRSCRQRVRKDCR